MGWGGARPGSGRKKNETPEQREERLARKAKAKTAKAQGAPAEPKAAIPDDLIRQWKAIAQMAAQGGPLDADAAERRKAFNPFVLPEFPPHAVPKDKKLQLAMDDAMNWASSEWNAGGFTAGGSAFNEGLRFPGFTYLAELAQRSEFRVMSETIADDATRKWIDFDVVGEEADKDRADEKEQEEKKLLAGEKVSAEERRGRREERVKNAGKLDRVRELKDDMARLELRDRMYTTCRDDGLYGRSHVFVDLGTDDSNELASPIGDGIDEQSKAKVQKGSLKRFRIIEPLWTYPTTYNAVNPMRDDWYRPEIWYVLGQQLHYTRCLPFISRPVPDILKPAYAFAGVSLSQLAKPYVDIWLQTRESVARLIKSFSVMVLSTDLNTLMGTGATTNAAGLVGRMNAFNLLRDNQGAFVINKNTEDFKNVNAPISGLDHLQAQAQEHMMCLEKNTLVETDRGQIPIEEITTQDMVMTRCGLAQVRWAGQTGSASRLVEIQAGDSVLRATEWHPIWSETTREFVDAGNVDRSHRLLKSTSWVNTVHRSLGAADGGGRPRPVITGIRRLADSFIAGFTRLTSALFQMASTFITSMTTLSTTALQTSSFSPAPNITSGISPRMAGSTSTVSSRRPSVALFAGMSSWRWCRVERSTVPGHVGTPPSEPAEIESIRIIELAADKPVYNIEVAEGFLPEFFANGILVHNSVVRIPATKFTGIQPSGLSTTSEGEMRAYYDTIAAYQNRFMRPGLTMLIHFEHFNLWGECDRELTFDFEPLWEMNEKEEKELQKMEMERHQGYVDMGAFSPKEIRGICINDPKLPYGDLDPDDVPDLREEEQEGLVPEGGGRATAALVEGGGEGGGAGPGGGGGPAGGPPGKPGGPPGGGGGPANENQRRVVPARDALPWGDHYEWMRGYHLPARTADGMQLSRDAWGDARARGLRIGSRVRYGYDGGGAVGQVYGAGRVFGFAHGEDGDHVAVLDGDRDTFAIVPAANVQPRPVQVPRSSSLAEKDLGGEKLARKLAGDSARKKRRARKIARDAEFEEGKHPRGEGGKFAKAAGGGAGSAKAGKEILDTLEKARLGHDFDSAASDVSSAIDALDRAGDFDDIMGRLAQITDKEREELPDDQVFTADEDWGELHDEIADSVDEAHAALHELGERAADALAKLSEVERQAEKAPDIRTPIEFTREGAAAIHKILADLKVDDLDYEINQMRGELETELEREADLVDGVAEVEAEAKAKPQDADLQTALEESREELEDQRDEVGTSAYRVHQALREMADAVKKASREFAAKVTEAAEAERVAHGWPATGPKTAKDSALRRRRRQARDAEPRPRPEPTMPKTAARYVDFWPDEAKRCGRCTMFVGIDGLACNGCTFVVGDIDRDGHCEHFEARAPGQDAAEWQEGKHPRGKGGQFTSGAGEGGAGAEHQTAHAPQFGVQHGQFTATGGQGGFSFPSFGAAKAPPPAPPINIKDLKKVGAQMGSNPGGVYEDADGDRFYVKKPMSKAHVTNELTAAALYRLARSPILKYRPVEGGEYVATEMQKLDKKLAGQLNPQEVREAQKDFMVHAWLGNYDAVGMGGDNLGTVKGVPTALDLGGALEFRAQGKPKGAAFGDIVGEIDTMRDPGIAPDASKIFGPMTPAQLRESARYVGMISDDSIRSAVKKAGNTQALAEKLVARKHDIVKKARMFGAEGDPSKPDGTMVVPAGSETPLKDLHGVPFKPWRPPADWSTVEGQMDLDEPDFPHKPGKKPSSGVIVTEKDGRVWVVQPKGAFGGYEGCVPIEDSEILTKRGWLRHDQVRKGDQTLGFDGGFLRWTKVIDILRYRDAEVVEYGGTQWSVKCTPHHRWLRESPRGEWTMVEAKDGLPCGDRRGRYSLRLSAPMAQDEASNGIDGIDAAIIGWLVTDGHVYRNGPSLVGVIFQKKERGIAVLDKLLQPVPHSKRINKRDGTWKYYLGADCMRGLLSRTKWSGAKKDVPSLVIGMSSAATSAFFWSAWEAEGLTTTNRGNRIALFQKGGPVFDAMAIGAYKLGYLPLMSDQPKGMRRLSACSPHVKDRGVRIKLSGRSDVWCVQTELGTWTMRQGRSIVLTGNTFPKGGIDEGLSPQANAIKEAWEESGLKVRITGYAGDAEGDSSMTRYYTAVREGGDPSDHGDETSGVVLAPVDKVSGFLNRTRDLDIARALQGEDEALGADEWKEGQHPRDDSGKFTSGSGVGGTGAAEAKTLPEVMKKIKALFKEGAFVKAHLSKAEQDIAKGEHGNIKKAIAAAAKLPDDAPAVKEAAKAGPEPISTHKNVGEGTEASVFANTDGKQFNVVYKDSDSGGTIEIKIYPTQAAAEAAAKEFGDEGRGTDVMRPATKVAFEHAQKVVNQLGIDPTKQPEKFWNALTNEEQTALKDHFITAGNVQEAVKASAAVAAQTSPADLQEALLSTGEGKIKAAIAEGMSAGEIIQAAQLTPEEATALEEKYDGLYGTVKAIKSQQNVGLKPNAQATAMAAKKGLKAGSFGGLWKETGKGENADYLYNAGLVVDKPAMGGIHYRNMMGHLIKQADKFGDASIASNLKSKLVESLYKAGANAIAKGKTDEANKLNDAISKIEKADPDSVQKGWQAYKGAGGGDTIVPPKGERQPSAAVNEQIKKFVPAYGKALEELESKTGLSSYAKAHTKAKLAHQHGATQEAWELSLTPAEKKATLQHHAFTSNLWNVPFEQPAAAPPPPKPPPAPPAQTFPPPTESELAKAKKNVALQLQYVPGAPQGSAEAQKLVDEFNAKYANNALTDPEALKTKVNDFKAMAAKMAPIAEAENAKKAVAEAAQKQKQAAANKAAAEQLKKSAEQAQAANKAYMAELGISQVEAQGFDALVGMMGSGSSKNLVSQFKSWADQAKKLGVPVTGFEYAMIRNYVDGGYSSANQALRSKSWSPKQHVYAKVLNKALDKLPKFTGTVKRGASMSAEQLAAYQPGYVVRESGFTSTGKNYSFGGEVHYTIKASGIGGADLHATKINSDEQEVLFKAGSYFLVHKVEKKGGSTYIEMEEIEGHG